MSEENNDPTYMYHWKKAPAGQVFPANEVSALEDQGWVDTPAKFPARSKLVLFCERATGTIGKFWRSNWQRISVIHLNFFYLMMTLCIILSFFFIYKSTKYEYVPATVFAGFTAYFSYHAYRFSKEKFRLDLFERRFEIYLKVMEFCSIVMKYGSLRENKNNSEEIIKAFQAAHESFRGIGFHKTHALFGEDVHVEFQKLNNSFAWLASFSDPETGEGNRAQWATEKARHMTIIVDMTNSLQNYFTHIFTLVITKSNIFHSCTTEIL